MSTFNTTFFSPNILLLKKCSTFEKYIDTVWFD